MRDVKVLSILWYVCDKSISLKQSCLQLFQGLQGIMFLQFQQNRAEQSRAEEGGNFKYHQPMHVLAQIW